jgi:hypothetical protein
MTDFTIKELLLIVILLELAIVFLLLKDAKNGKIGLADHLELAKLLKKITKKLGISDNERLM